MHPDPSFRTPSPISRLLFKTFKTVFQGTRAPLPDRAARPRRVLLLRHDRIGDMVMSTGLIRAIADAHPTITLDVLASRQNAAILDGIGGIGDVLVIDRLDETAGPGEAAVAGLRAARVLHGRRYDAVVDGLVLNVSVTWMTGALLAASGAPCRIGIRECQGRWRGGVERHYTHLVAAPADTQANHVEYLECLAGAFGVERSMVPHPHLILAAPEAAAAERAWRDAECAAHGDLVDGPRVLVNVSAGHPQRRWTDDQFIELVRHARTLHGRATLLVVGEPRDRTSVAVIAARSGATTTATASARAAFALIARADGVITPDTSVAHAASAFRKPCVTLMLPIASSMPFAPYRTPGRVILSPTTSLRDLPVEAVKPAIVDLYGLMSHYGWMHHRTVGRQTPGLLAAV